MTASATRRPRHSLDGRPRDFDAQVLPIRASREGTRVQSHAAFTTTSPIAPAGNFMAVINWGDGESSYGTVQGGSGSFTVVADHDYAAMG